MRVTALAKTEAQISDKSKFSVLQPSSVDVHGLCETWLETPKTGFSLYVAH